MVEADAWRRSAAGTQSEPPVDQVSGQLGTNPLTTCGRVPSPTMMDTSTARSDRRIAPSTLSRDGRMSTEDGFAAGGAERRNVLRAFCFFCFVSLAVAQSVRECEGVDRSPSTPSGEIGSTPQLGWGARTGQVLERVQEVPFRAAPVRKRCLGPSITARSTLPYGRGSVGHPLFIHPLSRCSVPSRFNRLVAWPLVVCAGLDVPGGAKYRTRARSL